MGFIFQLIIAELIDPLVIAGGIVAGIVMRIFGFWAGLAVIAVVPFIALYDELFRSRMYDPDYGVLALIVLGTMVSVAIWSVLGRWVAFMAAPRERPPEKNPLA